jgi:hypothetical protein
MADIRQATTRFEQFREHGDSQALDEAIAAYESVAAQPTFATLPELIQTTVLLTKGLALSSRYKQSQQASDLDQAIDLFRETINRTPLIHLCLPTFLPTWEIVCSTVLYAPGNQKI